MRKFNGKCFVFRARGDKEIIRSGIELGGEAGFDMSRNKISPRMDEPGRAMMNRETNHWAVTTRGADTITCRSIQCGSGVHSTSRNDTVRNRRDNEKYDQ